MLGYGLLMSIKTHVMNKNPRFTKHLVEKGFFVSSLLVVVDAGARGGYEDHWKWFKNQIRLIGFEPDEKECGELNTKEKDGNKKYYPVALSGAKGKRALYLRHHHPSSSFFQCNEKLLARLPDYKNAKIEGKKMVRTTDLDSFLNEEKIEQSDFLKLDTEGAEFDILQGAMQTLQNSIFGLSTEVAFMPFRKKQRLFSDVDILMRSSGFSLYDLPIFSTTRTCLSPYAYVEVAGPTEYGQAMWGQALYLRDAVEDFETEAGRRKWNMTRVLKLASIFELFRLNDCAIELLGAAEEKGIIRGYPVETFFDFLTPPCKGKIVSYKEYRTYLKKTPPIFSHKRRKP